MAISAAFTVNGAANPAAHTAAYGSTVTLQLASVSGVQSVTFSIVGVSKSGMSIPAITAGGIPSGATSTFVLPTDPGDGQGRAYRVKCVVRNGYEVDTKYAVVGVANAVGILPLVAGEELDRDATVGWIEGVNVAMTISRGEYATAAALRSVVDTLTIGQEVYTRDAVTAGDAGGANGGDSGYWEIVARGSMVDNVGTIVTAGGANAAVRRFPGDYYVDWFGSVASAAQTPLAAAVAAAGNRAVIRFANPPTFSGSVNLKRANGITFDFGEHTVTVATGSYTLFDCRSSVRLKFQNATLFSVAGTYSGILWNFRRDPDGPLSDTFYPEISCINVEGTGTAGAHSAATCVALDGCILGNFRRVQFVGGVYGVTGLEASFAQFSNVHHFDSVLFAKQSTRAVLNPGEAWKFTNCTFEPRADGTAGAFDQDHGTINCLTLDTCWFGDAGSGDWCRFLYVIGLDVLNCFNYGSSGIAYDIVQGEGVTFSGGRISAGTGIRARSTSGFNVDTRIAATTELDIDATVVNRDINVPGLTQEGGARKFFRSGSSGIEIGYFSSLTGNRNAGYIGTVAGGLITNVVAESAIVAPNSTTATLADVWLCGRDGSGNLQGNLRAGALSTRSYGQGTYVADTAPEAYQAIGNIADGGNTNFDFGAHGFDDWWFTNNAYYHIEVRVLVKRATTGDYREQRYLLSASKVAGTMTIEGTPVQVSGGWDNAGMTLTITATGGSLRVNVANSSGETFSGRCFVKIDRENLL